MRLGFTRREHNDCFNPFRFFFLAETLVMNSCLEPSPLQHFGGLAWQLLPWCSQQRSGPSTRAVQRHRDSSKDRPRPRRGLTLSQGCCPARHGKGISPLTATTAFLLLSPALASLMLQSFRESFLPKIYDLLIESMKGTTRSESKGCLLSQTLTQARSKQPGQSDASCG